MKKTWGYHLICDCSTCNNGIKDKQKIKVFVNDLLTKIKMRGYGEPLIVRFAEHDPDAVGYSLVQLIETSAITGHFSDNNLDAYLDIFSCAEFDPQLVMQTIQKHFQPEQIFYQFIQREAKHGRRIGFKEFGNSVRGECNHCGACCCSDAYILQEEGIAEWFEMHGYTYPLGSEQMANILVNKLSPDEIKITFLNRCKYHSMINGRGYCKIYEQRPTKCRDFPSNSEQIKYIPLCSFTKKEG